jgi:hypothetical protein
MTGNTSAWKTLIDVWADRERELHPDTPVLPDSIEVRDAVEHGDQVFVLISYDVEYPWPQEEDAPGEERNYNTAVIQGVRVRDPWIESDSARGLSTARTADGAVFVSEHPLGARRAISANFSGDIDEGVLVFEDASEQTASVVEGWMLVLTDHNRKLASIRGLKGGSEAYSGDVERDDVSDVMSGMDFTRSAGRSMYFSPLDLRSVTPLIQWERAEGIVVVAVCLERYDDGGVLRLRIDGIRSDDDMFVSWPIVSLEVNGKTVPSAVCGESSFADTVAMDVGFRPASMDGIERIRVRVEGLRGHDGPIAPMDFSLDVSKVSE